MKNDTVLITDKITITSTQLILFFSEFLHYALEEAAENDGKIDELVVARDFTVMKFREEKSKPANHLQNETARDWLKKLLNLNLPENIILEINDGGDFKEELDVIGCDADTYLDNCLNAIRDDANIKVMLKLNEPGHYYPLLDNYQFSWGFDIETEKFNALSAKLAYEKVVAFIEFSNQQKGEQPNEN